MIQEISSYEYLGNGLAKINSNMQEFNIRHDLLFSNTENWREFTKLSQIANSFNDLQTTLASFSANWKVASDLVYNLRGYWEQPIQITFPRTFNYAANFVEIETWLNENFSPSDFSPSQILRCDFLCKNYSDEMLDGYRLVNFDASKAEEQAKIYETTSNQVYKFLGIRNQLNAIISLLNALLKKYNNKTYTIDKIKDLSSYSSLVSFNKSLNTFSSSELSNFSNTDLAYFDSYVTQYNNLYELYAEKFIELEIIPDDVLAFFDFRDIAVTSGGAFFFKNVNNYWTYHPYTNIEFCAKDICSDCYDILNVNELYKKRDYCNRVPKYILTECGETLPYTGNLSLPTVQIITLNNDDLEQLSNLFI